MSVAREEESAVGEKSHVEKRCRWLGAVGKGSSEDSVDGMLMEI